MKELKAFLCRSKNNQRGWFFKRGWGAVGESGSTKGIYWYFQRVIMMKPPLKKQHKIIFANKYNKYCDFLLIQKSIVIL